MNKTPPGEGDPGTSASITKAADPSCGRDLGKLVLHTPTPSWPGQPAGLMDREAGLPDFDDPQPAPGGLFGVGSPVRVPGGGWREKARGNAGVCGVLGVGKVVNRLWLPDTSAPRSRAGVGVGHGVCLRGYLVDLPVEIMLSGTCRGRPGAGGIGKRPRSLEANRRSMAIVGGYAALPRGAGGGPGVP